MGYADGYEVSTSLPVGSPQKPHSLSLATPGRIFVLIADSDDERDEWIAVIDNVINRPVSIQENVRTSNSSN